MSSLAKSESLSLSQLDHRSHLTPAMAALKAHSLSQDVVVSAYPSDSRAEDLRGSVLCTKTVHFIRHGQGFHNLLADTFKAMSKKWTQFVPSESNPYTKLEVTDAPLTFTGRDQAGSLKSTTKDLNVELVIVSPHTRATQTGLIAFDHLVRATHDHQNTQTVNGELKESVDKKKDVPFVCVESCREEFGVHVCDKRRSVRDLKMDFPAVDYSGIESEEDAMFLEDRRESKEEIGARIFKFLNFVRERKETEIAVATHSGWLVTLFNGVVDCKDEKLMTWFETGEMRSVRLVWRKGEGDGESPNKKRKGN
jgi:broad specificity phosphatase PhoE